MTSPRLRHEGLAAAFEERALSYEHAGLMLAQRGIPGTQVYAMANALREAAALVRSVGHDRTAAARLADVAALRAQTTGGSQRAWELVRASIHFHLLENPKMIVNPLKARGEPPRTL